MPDVDASIDSPSVDLPSVEAPSVDAPSVYGGVDVEGAMPSADIDVSAPSGSLDVAGEISTKMCLIAVFSWLRCVVKSFGPESTCGRA